MLVEAMGKKTFNLGSVLKKFQSNLNLKIQSTREKLSSKKKSRRMDQPLSRSTYEVNFLEKVDLLLAIG